MASTFPGIVDALADNKTDTTQTANDHAPHHNALADGIVAVEQSLLGLVDANLQTKTPSGDGFLITNRIVGADAVGMRLRATSTTSSVGLLLDNSANNSVAGIRLQPDNSLQFVTGVASGGTLGNANARWLVTSTGHFQAYIDNTYDIGASGATRPRNVYVAGLIDAALISPAGNTVEQRNGTNAQTLRIYNTYTDASNYERLHLGNWTGDVGVMADNAGTGGVKSLRLGTVGAGWIYFLQNSTIRWEMNPHFVPYVDNTYDIGASGANRPRNIYQSGGTFQSANPGSGIANDNTNYERLHVEWNGNAGYLWTTAGGTGLGRTLFVGTQGNANLGLITANIERWRVNAAGHLVNPTDNTYDIGASAATRPRNIYQAGGTFQSYNPGAGIANDGTNFERLAEYWQSNVLWIETQFGGTGVARGINIRSASTINLLGGGGLAGWWITSGGHFFAQTDNTYDIGSNAASRPRNLYVAGQAQLGSGSANYLQIAGASTGNTPSVSAQGSDANVTLALQSKGTGWVSLQPGGNQTALAATATTSAVNYVTVTGAATGNYPIISAVGSDTNISLGLQSKGTGTVALQPNGVNALLAANNPSAVNYLQVANSATGGPLLMSAQGTDANIGITLTAKGTGSYTLTGVLAANQVASQVNYFLMTSAATGANPLLSVGGTDTNISLVLQPKGTGSLLFNTDNTTDIGAVGANRPRYLYLAGGITAGSVSGPSGNITYNGVAAIGQSNSGGWFQLVKATAATGNPGAGILNLYVRDGTNGGTLKLVVRAGAAGAETTILDNIPQ